MSVVSLLPDSQPNRIRDRTPSSGFIATICPCSDLSLIPCRRAICLRRWLRTTRPGQLQPVAEFAAPAHERGALFHCDAAQAAGKIHTEDRLPSALDGLAIGLVVRVQGRASTRAARVTIWFVDLSELSTAPRISAPRLQHSSVSPAPFAPSSRRRPRLPASCSTA
ncbi:aminotransferase class V-fold PLP-dependent enzyme [Streptomyces sp. BR123]|uniref:aminotransferase class V-fold PLP-dependent enzyme n=1 Tax=Streptomyces sp. BR123 TaxID=2749828 RepID=UPI00211AACF8|nr:aminotransferase class V-fold PLP-dependent enzyme [Streptomyces sp. BR123]